MKTKALSHPDNSNYIQLTQKQMDIIETIINEAKTIHEISSELNRYPNNIASNLKLMIQNGYVNQINKHYQAKQFNYYVGYDRDQSFRYYRVEPPAIEPFRAPPELRDEIIKLHQLKLSRSEIAKRLVIPKSQVLWTLLEGKF